MRTKNIKNEQWFVKDLINKIENKEIIKPKYQRKKKWKLNSTNENSNDPNEQSYIEFLFKVKNSVHAITFGQSLINNVLTYTNIDGNNRINAIHNFIMKPFRTFPNYLDDIIKYINGNELRDIDKELINDDIKNEIIDIFKNMSYSDIMNIKFQKYFETRDKPFYNKYLKNHRDDLELEIEKIQNYLKIDNDDRFDAHVSINVNLFDGYTTDELCQTFEDINKYNTKLTDNELLACSLYCENNFDINDNVLKQNLINQITKYYIEKKEEEALECYNFDKNDKINAYDFIVGMQNYCYEKYKIIEKTDNIGLSLFFKLYKTLYDYNFTTENINDFIEKICFASDILYKSHNKIFTEQLDNQLFNKTCKEKIKLLRKNNLFILLSLIIGLKKINISDKEIISKIEKVLLYHFLVTDLENSETKKIYKLDDPIFFEGGGAIIDRYSIKYIDNIDDSLNNLKKIDKNKMKNLLNELLKESLSHISNSKNRKKRNFFEKTMMFYYYKQSVSVNFLNNKFSIEHIFPFSSEKDETINIERLGNIVPIIHEINNKRSNSHISKYQELDKDFISFIDIIPSIDKYDSIIIHEKNDNKKQIPKIINNQEYNNLCENNEAIYINKFLQCLFDEKNKKIK